MIEQKKKRFEEDEENNRPINQRLIKTFYLRLISADDHNTRWEEL